MPMDTSDEARFGPDVPDAVRARQGTDREPPARRSQIWFGDLVRALAALEPLDEAQRRDVAVLLGLKLPAPPPTAPSDPSPSPDPTPATPSPREAPDPTTEAS